GIQAGAAVVERPAVDHQRPAGQVDGAAGPRQVRDGDRRPRVDAEGPAGVDGQDAARARDGQAAGVDGQGRGPAGSADAAAADDEVAARVSPGAAGVQRDRAGAAGVGDGNRAGRVERTAVLHVDDAGPGVTEAGVAAEDGERAGAVDEQVAGGTAVAIEGGAAVGIVAAGHDPYAAAAAAGAHVEVSRTGKSAARADRQVAAAHAADDAGPGTGERAGDDREVTGCRRVADRERPVAGGEGKSPQVERQTGGTLAHEQTGNGGVGREGNRRAA